MLTNAKIGLARKLNFQNSVIDVTKLEEMTPFEYLVNKRVDSVPVKKHIVKLNKNVSYFHQ